MVRKQRRKLVTTCLLACKSEISSQPFGLVAPTVPVNLSCTWPESSVCLLGCSFLGHYHLFVFIYKKEVTIYLFAYTSGAM